MSLTHITAIRNGLANYVVDALDVGSSVGDIVFVTASTSPVATCQFASTAFGAAAGGTATANTISDDTNAAGGTVAKFIAQDGNSSEIFRGTVTSSGGGGDIEMSSLSVGAGDTVSITSLTYSASV